MDLEENTNSPKQIQQNWYENLGDRDWDTYSLDNHEVLKRNIGFALYGFPKELPSVEHQNGTNTTSNNNSLGYDNKQCNHIMTIYELIKKYHFISDCNTILMRIIFILGKLKCDKKENKKDENMEKQKSEKNDVFQSPLFIIKKCNQYETFETTIPCNVFIDDQGRVYKSWKFYLENNKLPECVMYCPKNGQYNGEIKSANSDMTDGEVEVKLEVLESPACSLNNKILNHTDTAGTVVSVGSTAVMLASIIPSLVVPPAILGAAVVSSLAVGVYAVERSVATLVDRKKHDQSIGLKDSEARNCWLNASLGVLTTGACAASGLLTRAVGNGVKIGQGTKIAFNVIQASSLIGAATAVANSGYMLFDKKQNEEISKLEIFQFASSILFLCNSTVNFKTASVIITETQASTLKAYENNLRSNRHRKIFRKALLESKRLLGKENSQAEIISGIKKIDNKDNFFAGLARRNKEFNKNNIKYTINSDGKVILNSAHIVDPLEFASLTNTERSNIFINLPAPQTGIPKQKFNETKTSVNKWIDQYVSKQQIQLEIGESALKIAMTFFKDDFNCESIALILSDLIEESRNYILTIFTDFYKSLDIPVLKQLEELFPMVNTKMVILQFVKNVIMIIAKALNISVDMSLTKCNINMILKIKLEKWVSNLLERDKIKMVDPFIKGTKVKKECQDCNGYYFATKPFCGSVIN